MPAYPNLSTSGWRSTRRESPSVLPAESGRAKPIESGGSDDFVFALTVY